MAVGRQGKSITFTANADAIAAGNFFHVVGLTFQGSTLTAGQRLRLTDNQGGTVLCDYLVEAATDNADLWAGRSGETFNGLLVSPGPADGTWVLTVFLG